MAFFHNVGTEDCRNKDYGGIKDVQLVICYKGSSFFIFYFLSDGFIFKAWPHIYIYITKKSTALMGEREKQTLKLVGKQSYIYIYIYMW